VKRQIVLPFSSQLFPASRAFNNDLAHVGGFCFGLGLPEWVDQHMPGPGSGAGFNASEYVLPLVLMLIGGGRSLEDIRLIRDDQILRKILKLQRVPSPDAIGDWLRRTSARDGLSGLDRINQRLLQRVLAYDDTDGYTLDICPTVIVADKTLAKRMPDGHRGYLPLIGFLNELRLVVGDVFREGNAAPSESLLSLVQHCFRQMPADRNIKTLYSTGTVWQTELFNFCQQFEIDWCLGLLAEASLMRAVRAVPEPQWSSYRNGQLTSLVYNQDDPRKVAQLVVWRRPYQAGLFDTMMDHSRYTVIAGKREADPETIVEQFRAYKQRSRMWIAGLETEFAMARMPCGQTDANAVFYRIGTLAWNLYQLFASKITAMSLKAAIV